MSQDLLEPADSFYDVEIGQDYYQNIKDHLISRHGKGYFRSRFWVLPSFEKEYFLGTKKEEKEFFIIYRESKKNIGYDRQFYEQNYRANYTPEIVEIKRHAREEDIRLLDSLVAVAVINARFQESLMGEDGVYYCFSTGELPGGYKTASIWSPSHESATGELVSLLEEVVTMTKQQEVVKFSSAFRARILKLIGKFPPLPEKFRHITLLREHRY
jgi:hypothetical protein